MDLNGLMRLIFLEKNEVTFGVLIALTLLIVVLMLVRSVMEEKTEVATGNGGRNFDTKSINLAVEGAVKKALAEKTLVSVGEKVASGEDVAGDTADLKKILAEREAKIAKLVTDLETVKSKLEGKTTEAPSAGSDEDLLILRTKVNELQTKLSEYEIIEDDIADLSTFKEENKKLKDEVEKLRAVAVTAQSQVQAVQVAVDEAALPEPAQGDVVQVAQAAVTQAVPSTPFVLDTDDAVMNEFADALNGSKKPLVKPTESGFLVSESGDVISDPKAAIDAILASTSDNVADESSEAPLGAESDPFGPLDTEKMLAEVQSLNDAADAPAAEAVSVLDEQLDTDRLMAEMGMTAAPVSAPVIEQTPAAAESPSKADAAVDDLLAEFSDPDFQSGRETKGS